MNENARNRADMKYGQNLARQISNERTKRIHLEKVAMMGLDTADALRQWSNASNLLTVNKRLWVEAFLQEIKNESMSTHIT